MTPETAHTSPQAQREAPGHGSGPPGPPQASHAKIRHMAKLIRSDGAVSPFCAAEPKAISMARESWTMRMEAVTCKKCLAVIQAADSDVIP